MFIDASALTALLTDEDEARELLARLQQTGTRLTSPLAVWEAAIAVARVLDVPVSEAAEAVESYLALMEIAMVAVPPETARMALDAFDRFGKGRHPARPQFRGLLCLCLRPASGPALDVQGRRFSADRYRGRLTPCGARLGRQGPTGAAAGRGLFLPEEGRGLARGSGLSSI